MLEKFLFRNESSLPAKLLLVYILSALIIASSNGGYFLVSPLMKVITDGYSLEPFLYSLFSASVIYGVYFYIAGKFLPPKTNIILIYVCLFLSSVFTTIYLWMHIERGWQILVFYFALMFYFNRYTLISSLMLLIYIIIKAPQVKTQKKDIKPDQYGVIKVAAAFIYLCLAAGIPHFLRYQNITILEKASRDTKQTYLYDCVPEEDILMTKECVDAAITKKNNSFNEKWKNFVNKIKNPKGVNWQTEAFYNKNFIAKKPKIIDNFISIKQCYPIDKCKFSSKYVSADKGLRYDDYQNSKIRTESLAYSFYAKYDNKKPMLVHIKDKNYYRYNIKQYIESKSGGKNDVILSQTNGIEEVWAVGLEYIPLVNDNYFIIISIPRYVEKEKNKHGEYIFEYRNGYKFYTSCKGKDCYAQDLEISLDSRKDPSQIQINFGGKVYEIEIDSAKNQ